LGAGFDVTAVLHGVGQLPRYEPFPAPVAGDGEAVVTVTAGGMAEQTLVRRGMWLPVPDGVDDVTAAAVANPGMAASASRG
jgi:hypothetical protein